MAIGKGSSGNISPVFGPGVGSLSEVDIGGGAGLDGGAGAVVSSFLVSTGRAVSFSSAFSAGDFSLR